MELSEVGNGDPRPVSAYEVREKAEKALIGNTDNTADSYQVKMLRLRLMMFTNEDLNYEDARDWHELLNFEAHEIATSNARKILADSKHLGEFTGGNMLEQDFDDAILILAACHGDYERARTFLWKEAGVSLIEKEAENVQPQPTDATV